jgi:hypothetical protein
MRRTGGKLLLALGAPLAFTACATIGPPQPPSLELPKPPADLRAVRKGDKVLLTWTRPTVTTDRRSLRGPVPVLICRATEAAMSQCGTPVGHFTGGAMLAGAPTAGQKAALSSSKKARVADSYTDVLDNRIILSETDPLAFMTYAVEAVNANGRGAGLSNQVRVPLAATLPPPQDFIARVSDQGVVLSWTSAMLPPKTDSAVNYGYRVYRRSEGSQQQLLVGELPAGVERNMTLTDANIEWEQTYYFHAEAVTVIKQPDKPDLQIEGEDTADAKVFTHDIFPPAVPSGLQAVFSGPGQTPFIDLIWAPVTNADLAGYNVYRHEENAAPVRVNGELVKAPAYRDAKVSPGKTYFYSISAVDARGNESARSGEASESVPAD